jgi:hypothetical protein
MKRSIEIALKNKPSIIKPLYDKMKSLGVSELNLTVREDVPLSFTATAHLQRSNSKQEVALGTVKTEDGLSPDYIVQDAVPERYWRLGALSVPILMKIAPHVEESTLSCANLRCMKCSETTTKDCLLKILDFASGLCEDFALVGRFRCIAAIANLAVSRAFDRGRRALDLPLPPVWPRDGIYFVMGLSVCGFFVLVMHKWTKHVANVPIRKIPPFNSIGDVFVRHNFSERHAALSSYTAQDHEGDYILANDFATLFPAIVDNEDQGNKTISPAKKNRRIAAGEYDDSEAPAAEAAVANLQAKQEIAEPSAEGEDQDETNAAEITADTRNGSSESGSTEDYDHSDMITRNALADLIDIDEHDMEAHVVE